MAQNYNSGTLGAVMLMVGGIIGAGAALLLAPQSGERTRRQIVRCSRRARNQAEEMVKDAADAVSDVIEEFGDKTTDLFESGTEIAESWRNHLIHSIDQGQKNLEKQRKRLTQLWS